MVVHYFEGRLEKLFRLKSQVLFLVMSHDGDTVSDIMDQLAKNLFKKVGCDFDYFMSCFTLVTDSAYFMQTVFGASGSQQPSAVPEIWIACVSRRLNTVTKTVINCLNARIFEMCTTIDKDLASVKKTVAYTKRMKWQTIRMEEQFLTYWLHTYSRSGNKVW